MQSHWDKLPTIRVVDAGYLLAGMKPKRKWQFAPPLVKNFFNLIREKTGAVKLATMPGERMAITQAEFQALKAEYGMGPTTEPTTAPAQSPATPAPEAVGALVDSAKAGHEKPLQRTAAQDYAILSEIKKQGFDPMALPRNPDGKPGVKAAIRTALLKHSLFTGSTVFDKAWERLAARADIVIQG